MSHYPAGGRVIFIGCDPSGLGRPFPCAGRYNWGMDEMPKSSAISEGVFATGGILLGLAIGFRVVTAAYAYGWLAAALAFFASTALIIVLMIGGAVLGNYLGG